MPYTPNKLIGSPNVKSLSATALLLIVSFFSTSALALLSPEIAFAPDEPMDLGLDVYKCAFPEPPVIPSGENAPESELASAGAAVRDYHAAMQDSLTCIEDAIADLGEKITPEQDSALTTMYNNGVEQVTMIAESFNQQVRAFKARQSEEGN